MTEIEHPTLRPLVDHERVLAAARRCVQSTGAPFEELGAELSEVPRREPGGETSGNVGGKPGAGAATAPDVESAERAELLAALSLLRGLRSHLDELELTLIEGARERRASWSQISSALGLTSRQAAEQRWLRLAGAGNRNPAHTRAARQRQRIADETFGGRIASLRAAARAAHRQLWADPDWDGRHPRAALARRTLEMAGEALPSALFALVEQAVADLEQIPARQRAAAGEGALRRLRRAVAATLRDAEG